MICDSIDVVTAFDAIHDQAFPDRVLAGIAAALRPGGMFLMVGIYFRMLAKRHGKRPEDRNDGEIAEQSGDQGIFAPWSWWPLVLGLAAMLSFAALAIGWWIMAPALVLGVIGLVGWVFEFSRGQHAH